MSSNHFKRAMGLCRGSRWVYKERVSELETLIPSPYNGDAKALGWKFYFPFPVSNKQETRQHNAYVDDVRRTYNPVGARTSSTKPPDEGSRFQSV